MRAGGRALTLLAAPRIYLILQSLAEGTKSQLELRRAAGSPAQSTLRGHLDGLETVGAVEKARLNSFPGTLQYVLTDPGRELLTVAAGLESWLADAPRGPLELGGDPAKAAVKGLVEGWAASVSTSLASQPLSLTELDKRISTASYPTIERCLQTMRLADQVEVGERASRGTPYTITDWLRRGLAPLALAARWEHRHPPDDAASIDLTDLGGAIAVGAPLFELSPALSGVCQLATKAPGDEENRALGYLQVGGGKISFGKVYPEVRPDAWASGGIETWFATVIDADSDGLKLSGDRDLASTIFASLHKGLFEQLFHSREAIA